MLPEHYEVRIGDNPAVYLFESTGPRGIIEKAVVFTETAVPNFYNLGFGDVSAEGGTIDDLAVSDNGDMQKVLATIAHVVLDFTTEHPAAMIAAIGSTSARTRLYRMGIAAHYDAIAADFRVYGYLYGAWREFTKGTAYEAFYVKRKTYF